MNGCREEQTDSDSVFENAFLYTTLAILLQINNYPQVISAWTMLQIRLAFTLVMDSTHISVQCKNMHLNKTLLS